MHAQLGQELIEVVGETIEMVGKQRPAVPIPAATGCRRAIPCSARSMPRWLA